MNPDQNNRLTLYSYWRSSAAYRVRIALHLKGLQFETEPVHLVRRGGEQHSAAYRSVNPQGLVPVLKHAGQVVTQSMAICEYLDECFEPYRLLPADPLERATVRSLVLQIACEIHPLNNLRVQKYLKAHCGDAADITGWMSHWMVEGFTAVERQLSDRCSGQGYYGDNPGLFECFLVPQVYNAERYGTNMLAFPAINEIVTHCRGLPAFVNAAPENQPDAEPL